MNLKIFRIKDLFKFRILVGKCVKIKNIGKIIIEDGCFRVHLGTIHLFNSSNKFPLILNNKGTITIGGKVVIQSGVCLNINNGGVLYFSGNNYIGKDSLISVTKHISLGDNSQLSWSCQLCDSDFHYIKNIENNHIKPNTKPIIIGNNVWVGNNVCISKGVYIANNCIIAQRSMVCKSFNSQNKILIGTPAKEIAGNYERIFNLKEEERLNNLFLND